MILRNGHVWCRPYTKTARVVLFNSKLIIPFLGIKCTYYTMQSEANISAHIWLEISRSQCLAKGR